MYITIDDIIGEKRIDLSYPIEDREALALAPHSAGGPHLAEIAVVSMFSDNVQYWSMEGAYESVAQNKYGNNADKRGIYG